MNLYAYIPKDGKEPTGSDNRIFIRDLKTVRGAIKRLRSFSKWDKSPFVLQSFTSATNAATYTTVYTHQPIN